MFDKQPKTRTGLDYAQNAASKGGHYNKFGPDHIEIHAPDNHASIIVPKGKMSAPVEGFVRRMLIKFLVLVIGGGLLALLGLDAYLRIIVK